MLVEFWDDQYDQNPLEAHRNADGHVQFKDTGDPLIDKWEAQIARGEEPDFSEAYTEEEQAKLERLRKFGRRRDGRRVQTQSFKDVMDSITADAERQGLQAPQSLRPRKGWNTSNTSKLPSTFGDGSD